MRPRNPVSRSTIRRLRARPSTWLPATCGVYGTTPPKPRLSATRELELERQHPFPSASRVSRQAPVVFRARGRYPAQRARWVIPCVFCSNWCSLPSRPTLTRRSGRSRGRQWLLPAQGSPRPRSVSGRSKRIGKLPIDPQTGYTYQRLLPGKTIFTLSSHQLR